MSAVVCFVHTRAADADVVGAAEELQASLVDGTQRQKRRRAARAAQGVSVTGERASESTERQPPRPININTNRAFKKNAKRTGALVCSRMAAGRRACCW